MRWDRTEGPMLAQLVALAHSALEDRSDLELSEEGSTSAVKRFALKVHSKRVFAVSIHVEGGCAHLRADEIERSSYKIQAGGPLSADFSMVNEEWVAAALQELFSRIQSSGQDQ